MQIAVLNGSPKGINSVTMQYVLLLQKKLPQHDFVFLHVCQEIKRLEEKPEAFAEVLRAIAAADAVLWAFPLYYMLVAAHYKRFIELVFARGGEAAFRGKYAAALSTSIKFSRPHRPRLHRRGQRGPGDEVRRRLFGGDARHAPGGGAGPAAAVRRRLPARLEEKTAVPRRFPPVVADNFRYEPGARRRASTRWRRRSSSSATPPTRTATWADDRGWKKHSAARPP